MATNEEKAILRRDLVSPASLIQHFARIRNMLAGQVDGITLDQVLVGQLMDLLLCKLHDERTSAPDSVVRFQVLPAETETATFSRITSIFEEVTSQPEIGGLFGAERISISPRMVVEVVRMLQGYELTHAKRDVVGEAFEAFIGPSLRGNEGQFFTPRNVVELTCRILDPKPGEILLDPACGTGGFLTQAIRYATQRKGLTVIGIDKDNFLARIAAVQLVLLRDGFETQVFCANSLDYYAAWPHSLSIQVRPSHVDVIMTNPPFGAKIGVDGDLLTQFRLGRIWKRSRDSTWYDVPKFAANRPPQVLFIERCLDLLKPGGRLGIVLPDSILGNDSLGYIRQFISTAAHVVAIVDLPLETFLPSTSTKTSLLFLQKKGCEWCPPSVFMAIAEKCGHDRRGKPLLRLDGSYEDDLPAIADAFAIWREKNAPHF